MTIEEEEKLLQQLQEKSQSALKTIVVEFSDDLIIVAATIYKTRDAAYDAVVNCIIGLYNKGFEGVTTPIRLSLFKKLREACEVEKLE